MSPMKAGSLLALRVSLGWLNVIWGVDKLTNVEHSQNVAEAYYLGLGTGVSLLTAAGALQIVLGLLVVMGIFRRYTWPLAPGLHESPGNPD